MAPPQQGQLFKRKMPIQDVISPQKQDQLVQEMQSFGVVETLLQASVASFTFLRLFPLECFEDKESSSILEDGFQRYKQSKGADFDKPQRLATRTPSGGELVKVLKRGENHNADKLSDWVDAVLYWVLKKSLAGVQFSVFTDIANPSNVLEAYTFSFNYFSNTTSMALTDVENITIPAGSVRSSLRSMTRGMNEYCRLLPDLPENRHMMCYLFYHPELSLEPNPPGFIVCTNTVMNVTEDDDWHGEETEYGPMNSGSHHVGLKVLATVPGAYVESEQIPQYLQYTRAIGRASGFNRGRWDPVSPNNSAISTPMVEQSNSRTDAPRRQQNYLIGHRASPGDDRDLINLAHESKEGATGQRSLEGDSGCSGTMSSALRTDTLIATQVIQPSTAETRSVLVGQLLPEKSSEMERKSQKFFSQRQQDPSDVDVHKIQCQCGFNEEEGDMIHCVCCNSWQHPHCYGFILNSRPNQHVCYQCLLEDSDEARLGELKRLAQFRRSLWLLYDQDGQKLPTSQSAFSKALAKKLRVDTRTATQYVNRMKAEGYLPSARNSKLVPVKTIEQLSMRQSSYGNPLSLVGHFYEVPEEAATQDSQVADNMLALKRMKR